MCVYVQLYVHIVFTRGVCAALGSSILAAEMETFLVPILFELHCELLLSGVLNLIACVLGSDMPSIVLHKHLPLALYGFVNLYMTIVTNW